MVKQGEIDYLKNIGKAGINHAVNKPFSDSRCPFYLMEFGVMLTFLPKPPARLLDLGYGTGWTSVFLAKMGYDVTGVDICEDMIAEARKKQESDGVKNLQFKVSDYEHMNFDNDFDCAMFFDSLHHSVNEEDAIYYVYRALKLNGICITSEPGVGHEVAQATVDAVKKYGVTERDMPPDKIIAAGKKAGFRKFNIYPHTDLIKLFYEQRSIFDGHIPFTMNWTKNNLLLMVLNILRIKYYRKYISTSGITVLIK